MFFRQKKKFFNIRIHNFTNKSKYKFYLKK